MRYVAMSLRVALAEKFPDAAESEILKVSWVLRLFDSKVLHVIILVFLFRYASCVSFC